MKINKQIFVLYLIATILVAGSSGYLRLLGSVGFIIKAGQVLVCFMCFLWILKNKRLSTYSIAVFFFYIFLFISTFLGSKDFSSYASYAVQGIAATLFIEYWIEKKTVELLKVLRNVLFVALIINFLLLQIYPYGFGGQGNMAYYFLGFRIGFTPFVASQLFFSFLYDYFQSKKISMFTVCSIVVGFVNLASKSVATGIGAVAITLLLLLVMYCTNKTLNFNYFLILYGILFIAIVFFEAQYHIPFISYFLEDVMGRDLTFDNRTIIWKATIASIEKQPLLGYGSGASIVAQFEYNDRAVTAHNQILSILYEGGVVSLAFFVLMCRKIGIELKKIQKGYLGKILLSFLIGFFLIMFTEIQTTKALIFLVLATAVHLPDIIHSDKDKDVIERD